MNRLSVALMFVLCVTVLTSIGLAQQGGTVRGQIVNISVISWFFEKNIDSIYNFLYNSYRLSTIRAAQN